METKNAITSKEQLRVGDNVNVRLTSYELVRADWNTDRFKPEYDNQQLGKPKKVVTETTGVICDHHRKKVLKIEGQYGHLRDFKKTNSCSASFGGTPYKGVWYNDSATIISII